MIHLQILSKIYIIQLYTSFLYCQDIKLLGLEYKQSVTKCASGFLNYMDKLVYKSIINFTQPSNHYIFSTFFIKERTENDFRMLFSIHPLSACMERKDLDYYCEKDGDNIFTVFFTLRAQPSYTGAVIKAVMFDANKNEIKSDLQILPETYDVRNVTGTIKINEEEYNIDDCRANITKSDLKLELVCTSPTTPCAIEILTDNSQHIERFNNSVVWRRTLNSQQILNITLKYAGCRLDGDYNNITCIIQANTIHDTGYSCLPTVAIIFINTTVILSIIVILEVILIIRFRKQFAKKDKLKRKEYALLSCVEGEQADNLIYLDKSTLTDIFGINVVLKCYPSGVKQVDVQAGGSSSVEFHNLHDESAEQVIDLKKERKCNKERNKSSFDEKRRNFPAQPLTWRRSSSLNDLKIGHL